MADSRQSESSRRGVSTGGVLATLALAGGLTATAVVVGPPLLFASESSSAVTARHHENQVVCDLLGSLVGRSHAVAAVHQPGVASPYLEIVLWLEDAAYLGELNPDEVAIISHSQALQTITIARWTPPEVGDDDPPPAPEVTTSDISLLDFPTWWRDQLGVTRTVIAWGIERMVVDEVASDRGVSVLNIALSWSENHADGPDEASVLLDVASLPQTLSRTE